MSSYSLYPNPLELCRKIGSEVESPRVQRSYLLRGWLESWSRSQWRTVWKIIVIECHSQIYVWANHSGDKCWRPSYGEVRSCGFKVERRGHVGVESMRAGQQACHLKWNLYIWKEYHCSEVLSFILKSLTLSFKCSWNICFFGRGKECYFFRQKKVSAASCNYILHKVALSCLYSPGMDSQTADRILGGSRRLILNFKHLHR